MARSKATLGDGARLADFLSASLLARVYPSATVERVLEERGCGSQRVRSFPAVAVAYYAMSLSLYPEASYEEVFGAVTAGLAWQAGSAEWPTVSKSSISEARSKLSWQALRDLQARCCLPLATAQEHPEAFYQGLRLIAVDGSCFELPDEADNAEAFGYPGTKHGVTGYPQARCAVLVECGTHAVLAARLGAYRESEWSLARELIEQMPADTLCLADRGFCGYEHWKSAVASGAQLLWRMPRSLTLPEYERLADGSYRSALYRSRDDRRDRRDGLPVRVIDYTLTGSDEPFYRLLTTLQDETTAPAPELVQLYHERWEIEGVFDELKVHQTAKRRTLRSKTAALVRQEFYGWLLAHYAVRWLIHAAARERQLAARSLSFAANLQILRRQQPRSGAIPPSGPPTLVG